MANLTPNYNLKKPSPDEFYDVSVQNDNMDIIDEELNKVNEELNGITPEKIGALGFRGQLKEGTDLNDVMLMGSYSFTGVAAPTIVNSPITGTGCHLYVLRATNPDSSSEAARPLIQVLTTTSTNYSVLYWRKHASGAWTDWNEITNKSDLQVKTSVIGKDRIDIPANANLNDYITVGCFRCTSNSNTLTLTNCPTSKAFTMDVVSGTGWHTEVTASNGFVVQKILDHAGNKWLRSIYASSGSILYDDWLKEYTSGNKPTPDEIGACKKVNSKTVTGTTNTQGNVGLKLNPTAYFPVAVEVEGGHIATTFAKSDAWWAHITQTDGTTVLTSQNVSLTVRYVAL